MLLLLVAGDGGNDNGERDEGCNARGVVVVDEFGDVDEDDVADAADDGIIIVESKLRLLFFV